LALFPVSTLRIRIVLWIRQSAIVIRSGLPRLIFIRKKVPERVPQQGKKPKKARSELPKQGVKKTARIDHLSAKKEAHWGVILTYWGTFIALVAFGYALMDDHIFIATGLFVASVLQLLLGMSLWFGAHRSRSVRIAFSIITVALFVFSFYRPFINALTPTFAYLVPTHGLINSEQRAFFVEQSGPRGLSNVGITLRDNKAGTVHFEKYPEINPGPQDSLVPRYFWFTPSSPWDEDYAVTITSSKNPTVTQHIIMRSTQHVLQFAVQIGIAGSTRSLLSCRDSLLPPSYELARDSSQSCDALMIVKSGLEEQLRPSPDSIELPDGSLQIKRLRTLPQPSELEAQSEDRHLWEYQNMKIKSAVSQFRGARLLILATTGQKTWRYATEFRDAFRQAGWIVVGPKAVPPGDERIIDVQLSKYSLAPATEALTLRGSFAQAGVKQRTGQINDPDVPRDLIVLWVGPKSPEGITPDDCAPPRFKPRIGEPQPCDRIKAIPGKYVPFPPP